MVALMALNYLIARFKFSVESMTMPGEVGSTTPPLIILSMVCPKTSFYRETDLDTPLS
jgi:hypothetical protein